MSGAARQACEALIAAFCRHADAREADALAALFAPDAVFDRLGTEFVGRDAIRQVIAGRPAGVWTRHTCSNVQVEVDGSRATGTADLEMRRGTEGAAQVEVLRGIYLDQFVLTADGWKFQRRSVRLS